MLNERNRKTAERFGILPLVEKLQTELMALEGVEDVDFDLDLFWSDIRQVIFLPKYRVIGEPYYQRRSALLRNILDVAAANGLTRTNDSIEDYGAHFYIVTEVSA